MHATAFLSRQKTWEPVPVVVLSGEEAQLKSDALHVVLKHALGEEAGELECSRYAGPSADLKSIRDELLTVSMFSSGRVVVIEDADEFISRNRAGLEDYLDRPARASVLVLSVKSWPKTTRLAKRLPQVGLEIECSELTGGALLKWITDEAQSRHGKQVSREVASLIVELAGGGLSLVSRELEKLAAYAGERERITADDVRALVGGWRAQTTWEMLDAVRDGRADAALRSLDHLLTSGEAPQRMLGGINYVFRKFAEAVERSRGGAPLRAALQQSGVFPRDVEAAERYLRRIGRPRAEQILPLLAQADSNLKGGSRVSDRLQLETLLLALCGTLPLS